MSRALIVVDMQNDFVHPRGALYVKHTEVLCVPIAMRALNSVLYGPIVLTQDWHDFNDASFKRNGGLWPEHCLKGSWGAALDPEFADVGDIILRKPENSAFFANGENSGLYEYLEARGVKHVDIVGVALEYCVKETALDAAQLGFDTTVLLEMTAAVDPRAVANVVRELKEKAVRIL